MTFYFQTALRMTKAVFLGALLFPVLAFSTHAAPVIGQLAPDFSAMDITGKPFKLLDHRGKIVVLEWTNHECPFVQKHYGTGNMQKTQKEAVNQGVVWVSIVSSAPGRQGHTDTVQAQKIVTESGAVPTAKILDESGAIGGLYGASTTPDMFVIDEKGLLVYSGAIDDNSSPNPATVEGAKNYVLAALSELKSGKGVSTPQTQPYGCGVKYDY